MRVIVALGASILLVFHFAHELHLPEWLIDTKNLAYSVTVLIQILRGLAYHLDWELVPRSFQLKKMDLSFFADTTLLFFILFAISGAIVKSELPWYVAHGWQVSLILIGTQVILGVCLSALSLKRTKADVWVVVLASIVLLSPCLGVVVAAYGTYTFLHVEGPRSIEILLVATLIPVCISAAMSMLRDSRNRFENTRKIIGYQFMTLPAVPLIYMLMDALWPKNWSPFLPLEAIMVVFLSRGLYIFLRFRKAWLVKERCIELATSAQQRDLKELQADIRQVLAELTHKRLILKDATDHIDKADAYAQLGELQNNLMQFSEAETCFRAAIDAYNDALKLEPDNRTAIANKFKTVQSLDLVQRNRF